MQLSGSSPRTAAIIKSQLHGIWLDNLPIMRDRLDRLEAFAVIAGNGEVTAQQHCDALNIAHKMAGSLGIFGFTAAGELAHRMELMLRSSQPIDAAQLTRLNDSLRSSLNL